MLSLVVTFVLLAPEVPPQCAAPPQRDMGSLTQFAQTSGSLSVGLDSVATWCFDSGGAWTGGAKKPNPATAPTGDCKRAIAACEGSKNALSEDARRVMFDTLAEMEKPFLGVKYTPKRSGLAERPSEDAECSSKDRATLFANAQARMDLGRLASVTQNEYANYRTWLFSEGLKCAQAVARGEKDLTRRGVAVDGVTQGGGTQTVPTQNGGPNGATGRTVITGAGPTNGTNGVGGGSTAGSAGASSGVNSGSSGVNAGGATVGSSGVNGVGGSSGGGATVGSGGANAGVNGVGGSSGGGATAGSGANAGVNGVGGSSGGGANGVGGATVGSRGANTGVNGVGGGATTGSGGANTGVNGVGGGATGSGGVNGVGGGATVGSGGANAGANGVGGGTTGAGNSNTVVGANGRTGNTATTGTVIASAGQTGTKTNTPFIGGPTAEREKALGASTLEKWRYFLGEQQKIEGDIDWTGGFLVSRELRDCRCVRPIPGEVVRRLEKNEKDPTVVAEDDKNTRCELCLLDAYPRWRSRATKQCALALELTEYEIGVIQRSDDGNGLPQRCVDAAKDALSRASGGRSGKVTFSDGTQKPANNGGFIIMKNETPAPQPVAEQPKPTPAVRPMPPREDGRIYVRVFTSSNCSAEVLPGPVVAHNGDVLPVPTSAKEISVRGDCGGIAELYFGKEEKPRVSESFARNQPLRLQFRQ